MTKGLLVVDTSVIIKWLNTENEKYLEQADLILKDVQKNKFELIAPELAKYEVGNVLLKSKRLSKAKAKIVLDKLYKLPIIFLGENSFRAKDAYSIASELGITYYDAAFLSVSKQYEATLVTDNTKHQGKSKKFKVMALKDYKI